MEVGRESVGVRDYAVGVRGDHQVVGGVQGWQGEVKPGLSVEAGTPPGSQQQWLSGGVGPLCSWWLRPSWLALGLLLLLLLLLQWLATAT